MSQHDFQIDSGNGFGVRADINAAIQALASNNTGPTEPPIKYAGMWWSDTNTGIVKQRNVDNSAWIERFPLNGTVPPRVKFVASGTVNAIAGVTNVSLTSYPTGWQFTAWVSGANTLVAPTLSLDGLPAKTIKKQGSAGKVPLVIGDYNQFGPLILEYDGSDFLLLNPLYSGASGTQIQLVERLSVGYSTSASGYMNLSDVLASITTRSINSVLSVQVTANYQISKGPSVNAVAYLNIGEYISSAYTPISDSRYIGSRDYSTDYLEPTIGVIHMGKHLSNSSLTTRAFSLLGGISSSSSALTASVISISITETQA